MTGDDWNALLRLTLTLRLRVHHRYIMANRRAEVCAIYGGGEGASVRKRSTRLRLVGDILTNDASR
jgi:hypothetical protein